LFGAGRINLKIYRKKKILVEDITQSQIGIICVGETKVQ